MLMKKLMSIAFMISIGFVLANPSTARGDVPVQTTVNEHLIITRLQTGGTGSGTSNQEYVQLYNPSMEPVDITNWCLLYNTSTTVVCFKNNSGDYTYSLNPESYLLTTSSAFLVANPTVVQDFTFSTSSNIASTNGSIALLDETGDVVDRIGWGTGLSEGGALPGNIVGGTTLERKKNLTTSEWIDTDQNVNDFSVVTTPTLLESGGVLEAETPYDACSNIDGLQNELPDGYLLDNHALCQKDVCLNIDELQLTVPDGYQLEVGDICTLIPLEDRPLFISELLPNPASYDTGLEFIEVHNPNNDPVSLKNYTLEITTTSKKSYLLMDAVVPAKSYVTILDSVVGYTLTNTGASLKLITPAGTEVSSVTGYTAAPEDQSWSLVDDVWQYTNQPTPGAPNLPMLADPPEEDSSGTNDNTLPPCGEGKYRNPETNRCKSTETTTALSACPVGQTRNPETNRCRSNAVTASTLTPCKEGQYRNPETNRCKSIETASVLVPCKEGQERNPETNRCRNISAITTSSTITDNLAPTVDRTTSTSAASYRLFAGIALLTSVIGYAVYEWRSDIGRFFRKR